MPSPSQPLRVTQVSAYLDPAQRAPDELLRAWRDFGRTADAANRAGVRVTVVQASWKDAVLKVGDAVCHFVREGRSPVVRVPGGPTFCRARLSRLWAQVGESRPDVIHWQGLLFPRQLRSLARVIPGVPIVAQDHGSAVPRRLARRWMHRWGFRPLAGVMFTATDQAAPFKAAGVLRRDLPVYEVVEGSSPFSPGDQARARQETGLGGNPCLLWVGNLDSNKDPLTVLDAVSRVAPKLPGLTLWMCYRFAPLLEAVRERMARDPALRERVRLVGEVRYPAIEGYFRAADFLVQASHKEGSGYGVIEALACGTTPLVTGIPSFRTITGQGEAGALVPVDHAEALAGAIADWAGRDRAGLRRRARAHFDDALSFDAIGRQLAATYHRVRERA